MKSFQEVNSKIIYSERHLKAVRNEVEKTRNELSPEELVINLSSPRFTNIHKHLKEIAKDGYVAVIDLRTANENRGMDEQSIVESLGMEYVALPISGRNSINFENAMTLDQILNSYDQPVLVHCGTSNRVGALLALREKINGASIEDALKFGRSAGMTTLEGVVKARLSED